MTNLDYLYNKNAAADFFDKNHFVDEKLTFETFERATILPQVDKLSDRKKQTWGGFGGLVDGNLRPIDEPTQFEKFILPNFFAQLKARADLLKAYVVAIS